MSNPDVYQRMREAGTKLKLLRLLWWFTANSEYPTATKLAHQIDARDRLPRATVHARRKMVQSLHYDGLAQAVVMDGAEHTHYAISPAGIELLKAIDKGSQS